MTKKKKIITAVIFFIIILASAIYIIPFIVLKINYSINKHPILFKTPLEKNLPDSKYVPMNYQKLSYLGVTFKVPWKKITREYNTIEETTGGITLWFNENNKITLGTIDESRINNITWEENFYQINDETYFYVIKYFKECNLKTNYDYFKTIFYTTPNDLKIFSGLNEKIAIPFILLMKGYYLSTFNANQKEFYSFSKENIKGFVFPDYENNKLFMYLFDDKNQQYERSLFIKATKDEIEYIISSIEIK